MSGFGSSDCAGASLKPMSPVRELEEALNELDGVSEHARSVATQIVGAEPPAPTNAAPNMTGPGGSVFTDIRMAARRVRSLAGAIRHSMNRIGDQL